MQVAKLLTYLHARDTPRFYSMHQYIHQGFPYILWAHLHTRVTSIHAYTTATRRSDHLPIMNACTCINQVRSNIPVLTYLSQAKSESDQIMVSYNHVLAV